MDVESAKHSELITRVKLEADRCVACGLCLPHCPTYRETRTENESPRGRIALMRALARDDLPVSARLESHLGLCLTCRNCETVCPAKVGYGRLIDSARALIEARRPRPFTERIARKVAMDTLLARPRKLRLVAKMLRLYQKSGAQWLLRSTRLLRLSGLARWDDQLPLIPSQPAWRAIYPAPSSRRIRVGLFTGCVTGVLDRETLTAAIHILTRLGYDVHVPHGQVCCGALHQHAGALDSAATLMRHNIDAFGADRLDAIISIASGCGAMLAEYAECLAPNAAAATFSAKVKDINRFAAEAEWPDDMQLTPLNARIAVHDPCTLTNVLHDENHVYRLLAKIPGAEIEALPENNLCCGAAGVYFLTQRGMANDLRAHKLDSLRQSAPDVLVTSNVGCALHLAQGVREARLGIEVLHPMVLIQRQLQPAGNK